MAIDRRDIAPLLGPIFPSIPNNASSDDWHGFLNAMTGLDIPVSEENASAFDKWRQALAEQGHDTWGISKADEERMAQRGVELKALEEKRVAALATTLEALAKEAPQVTAQQLLDQVAPKP